MEPAHPFHPDQPSPTFADSAIDMELSDKLSISHIPETNASPLPDRLARLVHLASEENARFSEDESDTLHHALNTIESLLDPRPRLTQEIFKCRPQSIHSETATSVPSRATPDRPAVADRTELANKSNHPQLTDLLDQVTALNQEMHERRKEAYHIYDLFGVKCQGLSRKISELKSEIQELQADILEDSIEREGLRGTIHGLEGWVEGWEQDRALARISKSSLRNGRKTWKKCKTQHQCEDDSDALLEGMTGWMRGWKDIDEGFRIRERERKLRREERQKQRIDAGDEDESFQVEEVIDFGESDAARERSTLQFEPSLTTASESRWT